MSVIDLDRPAAEPPVRSRRPFLLVFFALVVGAVLGATATFAWYLRAQGEARGRQVSVFAFAETRPFGDHLPISSVVQRGRVSTVTFTRRVTLVNAGPVPVDVRELSASGPGVSVRGLSVDHSLDPGTTSQVDADVYVDCVHGLPLGRLPATLLVRTSDDQNRESRLEDGFDGTPWNEQAEIACAGRS